MLSRTANTVSRARWWTAWRARRSRGALERALRRLWFDTHVHDSRVLNWVIDIMGTDKLLLGTNFAGWDQHAMTQDVSAELALTMSDNAKRLLRVNT